MSEVNLLIPQDVQPGEARPDRAAILEMRLTGQTMGTVWSATWFAAPGFSEQIVLDEFEALFAGIIASMSPWDAGSLISQFNRLAPGDLLTVDEGFAEVMGMGLEIARASGGQFDPCLGGEVMRRGFGPAGIGAGTGGDRYGPDAWQGLIAGSQIICQPGSVTLDLSAIAKGYAVDRMARILGMLGVSQFLVEIGGEFVARGVKPDRSPWWINLENPCERSGPWRLALVGKALATSGDYRRFRMEAGERISHIVTGSQRRTRFGDLACVSVVHDTCAQADGWATALFASGDETGLALADAQDLAAIFQYRDAPARLSRRMRAMMEQ